jgi:hypothetical protein
MLMVSLSTTATYSESAILYVYIYHVYVCFADSITADSRRVRNARDPVTSTCESTRLVSKKVLHSVHMGDARVSVRLLFGPVLPRSVPVLAEEAR